MKTVMLSDTLKSRNGGCPKWVMLRHNLGRKTVATEGNPPSLLSGMSRMLIWYMLNGTPKSRNAGCPKRKNGFLCASEPLWLGSVQNVCKMKTIVLNGTPNSRNAEARECGSVPRLRVPRMRERKARKVKDIVLNNTPKCRNAGCPEWKNGFLCVCGQALSKMCRTAVQNDEEREKLKARKARKVKDIVLNNTPKCRSAEARECGSEKREKQEKREKL